MNENEIVPRLLDYVRGEHTEEALLIGWICLLAHSLFLPVLSFVPALGYLVSVMRATLDEEPTLPPVSPRSLLSDSVAASTICLLYGAIPLAVGTITISLVTETTIDPAGSGSILFLTGSTVTLFVVLVGLYVLPIALCAYAGGGVRDTVPDRSFLTVGTNAAYFIGWTSAVLILAAGWLFGGVVEFVPVLGAIFAPLVWWIVLLIATRRLAAAYEAAR